jgi:hypothetical protein
MFGIDDAIIGAIAGSAVSGLFSSSQASQNRSFQAGMSNTAHQRQMADMKKAGLNPILSARYGGATTPAGAMGTITPPDFVNAISTAATVKRTDAETKLIEQQAKTEVEKTDLTKEQKLILTPQAELLVQQAANQMEQANLAIAHAAQADATAALTKDKEKNQEIKNVIDGVLGNFYGSHEYMLLAKEMGMSPGDLMGHLSDILKGVFLKRGKGASKSVTEKYSSEGDLMNTTINNTSYK